ncbi:uncharacterized protein [Coffea arabica]|uniref:Uncharacterized protein isoform X1 n=1 Tax=Coffea arabica TaxID=13443 RepID=A0A6P6VZC4_COFAR|nr:RNA polymerase II-associated protein 3-like isoform X1 [Coffea arabica]XP_027114844.1 RNA polymerase II-associated protein 3-like isoform X1 [Coffea arabica]
MSRVPSKHSRDQAQDFEGLLNNLQDWELSFKDKDKKLKSQSRGKEKADLLAQRHNVANANQLSSSSRVGERHAVEKNANEDIGDAAKKYDYLRNYDAIRQLSSGFMTEESSVDANSEKELGNEYFKHKKFNEAIDCYSRSIALLPTAVAYANRAMAYIKIKRFEEAESDCTEALNLDDRYIKAYSRRSTARKELGKLKEAYDDAEFALRLEPQNQEIKKQYAEAKSLLDKEILKKVSRASTSSVQGLQKAGKSKVETNKAVNGVKLVSSDFNSGMVAEVQDDHTKGNNGEIPLKTAMRLDGTSMKTKDQNGNASHESALQNTALETMKRSSTNGKHELKTSVQELAARAATLAKAEAAKIIAPPNSAYQFEVSWRGLSGDRSLQAQLLKATPPTSLPQIFKNALSASLLMDILGCIATFFVEDVDLAVKFLENLTKIPRFDMIVMCLSSADKADLFRMWNEVFGQTTPEYAEILSRLRSRYRLQN